MSYKKNTSKLIIEIGVNHNGNIKLAKKMIDVIAKYDVDYIKFQSFLTDELCVKNAKLAQYQKKNLNQNISQFQMLKKYELNYRGHLTLYNYCKKKKIKFVSSVFGYKSFNLYNKFKTDFIKIPSGEINNIPFLNFLDNFNKNIILSTGMATPKEINNAVNALKKTKNKKKLTLMHCVSSYPAKFDEMNLNSIKFLKKKYNLNVGLSDHTDSTIIPFMAHIIGANYIEKHFTLNKSLIGPDHKASIDEAQLKEIVYSIKNKKKVYGKFGKFVSKSEKINKLIVRKSIYASKNILKNEKFTSNNICLKRPSNGIGGDRFLKIIGKKAKKNYKKDDLI